ncbi:MAG: alpha/beta fold hydrolase, partial [Planctomycetota bacterium]
DEIAEVLDGVCRGDPALRVEVESLLAAQMETGDFLPDSDADSSSKPAVVGMSLTSGDVLMERYEIAGLLGSGGMGTVYRAKDRRLGRDVAIKVLSVAHAAQPEMRERFEREMRSAAAFSHPNVMEIHDLGVHDGNQVAVMEFIEGDTLRELIHGGMQTTRAAEIGVGIAAGLEAAHNRGLLHRDIKPENIMVSPDGHVKILDFGLARPQEPSEDQNLTRTSMTPGTIPYMSPEQSAGQKLECSTDLFSFGTVLYEMISGSNPFLGATAVETMRRVVSADAKPLSSLKPDVPERLEALVVKMLDVQPSSRPTAEGAAQELKAVRDQLLSRNSAATRLVPPIESRREELPSTQYARCGDIHIAYQTFGDGPVNLLVVPGFISNVDNSWASPALTHWLRTLGSFARVATFDKRGTGLSDRVGDSPNMEQRVEDVCAVMDAVGFDSAALLGISEGGSLASVFAASYPQRCEALILHGSFAKFSSWFDTSEALEGLFDYIRSAWGSGASLPAFAPSFDGDADYHEWWGKFERLGANPNAAIDLMRMNSQIDITRVLPSIQVPTLVVNRTKDVLIDPEASQFLTDRIEGAVLFASECADHVPFFGEPVDRELAAIHEFLHSLPDLDTREQVLATVLAVQLAESATEAVRDRVRQQIDLNRGSVPVQSGHCLVSTFEGPVRAIRCAKSILASVSRVRLCVHTGQITLGGSQPTGPAVDLAKQVALSASDGEIVVTRIVRDIAVDSGLRFASLAPTNADSQSTAIYRVE